ncbi:uncharacterized protein LOC141646020 [Silene latifolia]|uniref:uncharacterized protein LOC141646020 n=1 Tax=Silene latifolia TaxID=37657 RepID=UPI003D785CE4
MDNISKWNVRGMNKLTKQLEIKRFLHQNNVGLYGLVETKIKDQDCNRVLANFGQQWKCVTNIQHHPGGKVWLIWMEQISNVTVITMSDQQITTSINKIASGHSFLFTVVYGSNDEVGRLRLWEELKSIKDTCMGPWSNCVDFNNLLDVNERIGRPVHCLIGTCFFYVEKAVGVDRVRLNDLQLQMHRDPYNLSTLQAESIVVDEYRNLSKAHFSFLSQKAKIKEKEERIHSEPQDIEQAFLDYYITLLGSSTATNKVHIPTVRSVSMINEHHKSILLKPLSLVEIKNCIFAIPASKSLGELLKQEPEGFVQGRNIVENVLICQDLVRLYNRKAASPRCLIKIDLRKDYDTVEWTFLHQMLQALKFPNKFIKLIMTCVSSPSYSLNVNGNTFGFFHGNRGLRQGDPLSLLLFTLCMEYLSRILHIVAQQDNFRFHPMCGHIRLNHLLFADDLLMFYKGNESSIMWMLRAFSTFSATSRLCLNRDKTNIYFNGVRNDIMEDIVKLSSFRIGKLPFKYLGYESSWLLNMQIVGRSVFNVFLIGTQVGETEFDDASFSYLPNTHECNDISNENVDSEPKIVDSEPKHVNSEHKSPSSKKFRAYAKRFFDQRNKSSNYDVVGVRVYVKICRFILGFLLLVVFNGGIMWICCCCNYDVVGVRVSV